MRIIPIATVLILVLGIPGVARASEAYTELELARYGLDKGRSDEAAILQAVQGFAVGFIQGDLDMIMGLWDASAAKEVSFIQVENEHPVVGLSKFRAYYAGHLRQITTLDGDVSDVHIQRMGNIAIVSCRYTWVSKYVENGHVAVNSTRATITLRKHGQRWLYIHMHESMIYS
ncbi:YybH family protein [Archangium lansingense]|uniref:Nuclear transport factor 2 family protein n=1 Tax=Archangium lansingense TaxID=2995310 RepID=A0ABT3ZZU8_9BACT|nr:nuclear transport factor 2 family protein [Archangium lansinium]MCY1074601.1 nuclear transport factor 2 family protein [Archangium lansinium]